MQGTDYAYTLQGWLKGINATSPNATYTNNGPLTDMGGDADAANLNRYTAKDAYGLTLNYYTGDYSAINGSSPFPGYSGRLSDIGSYRPLYNGNISSSSVYQKKFDYDDAPGGPLIFYNYKYDQLNRLKAQDAYKGFNTTDNSWAGMTPMGEYLKERIAYDANGNILKYLRNSISGSTAAMDSLTYWYNANTNQLNHVADQVVAGTYHSDGDKIRDINTQSADNYTYDAIGNLVADNAENITSIKWNVYGKITEINKAATADLPATKVQYTYDAAGNRISQVVTKDGTKYYTWYVRDAQGNMLTTYSAEGAESDLASLELKQTEQYLYGSSRLGLLRVDEDVDNSNAGPSGLQYYDGNEFDRGSKEYELTNHLGNVLATISDRKLAVSSTSNSSLIDHYEPHILTAQDYYPFGMLSRVALPNNEQTYRFGFNGKENDNDVKGLGNSIDYGMRVHDPRIGRFLSVDPLTKNYPWYTPYQFAGNSPNAFTDLDGGEPEWMMLKFIHWAEGQTQKQVVTKNTTNKYVLFGYGFMHGVAASVDVIGMGNSVIDIFKRANNSGDAFKTFTACVTGDCAFAQATLLAASPEYGIAKMIDDKINKGFHGDAYDRGEIVAEAVMFLLPIAQEAKEAHTITESFNMKLALAIEHAGIPAEETTHAESYLLKALRMEGWENGSVLKHKYQKKWIEGEYLYEVRVHVGNKKFTDAKDIFRVSRKK